MLTRKYLVTRTCPYATWLEGGATKRTFYMLPQHNLLQFPAKESVLILSVRVRVRKKYLMILISELTTYGLCVHK